MNKFHRKDNKSDPVQASEQSTTLAQLAELVVSPDSKTEQVIELIKEHSGLAESIVNRANSPEFALRHQILRIEHAIAILGQNRTVDAIKKFETAAGTSTTVPAPHFHPIQDSASVSTPDATV